MFQAKRRATLAACGLSIAVALLACKNTGKGNDDGPEPATAANAAATFSGTWDTPWGPVAMTQSGTEVSGSYTGPFTGTLQGTVTGNVLDATWVQTNGERGKARLSLASDGSRFTGTWGGGSSATNGGPWNGTRK